MDEPIILQPVIRRLEIEAIALYRAKYPDAPAWQELSDLTRGLWVDHAESEPVAGSVMPDTSQST